MWLRLTFFIAVYWLSVGYSPGHAEVCPDAPGEKQEIGVPSGRDVRVMVFKEQVEAGEASYVEICERRHGKLKLVFAGLINGAGWYYAITLPADSGAEYYLKNYSVKLEGAGRRPWVGMRKLRRSYGYTFAWFDELNKRERGATVDYCIYRDISECPDHSPAPQLENLAEMSEYARGRWLWRRMKSGPLSLLRITPFPIAIVRMLDVAP